MRYAHADRMSNLQARFDKIKNLSGNGKGKFSAFLPLRNTFFSRGNVFGNVFPTKNHPRQHFTNGNRRECESCSPRRRASSTSSVPQRSLPNRQTKSAIDRPNTRDLTVVVDTVHLSLPATVTKDMLLAKPRGGKTIPYERNQSSLRKPQTFGGR